MSAPESHLNELLVRGGTAWVRHTLERLERGEGFDPDVWRTLAGYAMEVTRHLEPAADEMQGVLSAEEITHTVGDISVKKRREYLTAPDGLSDVSGMAYDD